MTVWATITMEAGEPLIKVVDTARQDMEIHQGTHHGTHEGLPAIPKLHVGVMLVP